MVITRKRKNKQTKYSIEKCVVSVECDIKMCSFYRLFEFKLLTIITYVILDGIIGMFVGIKIDQLMWYEIDDLTFSFSCMFVVDFRNNILFHIFLL